MDIPLGKTSRELSYLDAFHAVCDQGTFTAAARRLGLTQPAISYQIRMLEEVVGHPLLERGGSRVVLTPEGRRYRAFTSRVLRERARLRTEWAGVEFSEPLRVGCVTGFGRYVLVPALRSLRTETGEAMPDVRLEFEAADVILDRLEAGEYEAVFVYKRRVSNQLCHQVVYDEELVLVADAARACRLAEDPIDSPEELCETPFVTYEECEYVFGWWFASVFGEQPAGLVSRCHFTELEEVLDLVRDGAGLSVVPRDAAEGHRAGQGLGILYPGSGEPCRNQVFMVTRTESRIRSTLERLVAHLPDPEDGGASG